MDPRFRCGEPPNGGHYDLSVEARHANMQYHRYEISNQQAKGERYSPSCVIHMSSGETLLVDFILEA